MGKRVAEIKVLDWRDVDLVGGRSYGSKDEELGVSDSILPILQTAQSEASQYSVGEGHPGTGLHLVSLIDVS